MTIFDFLSPFFPDEDETVHLRAFKAKTAPDTPNNGALTLVTSRAALARDSDLQARLQAANQERGIYFVVNSGGNCDDDIIRFNAYFAEDDERSLEEQHRRLDAAPIQPSIRVVTRRSVHGYWLIEGPCTEAEWRDVQARLIRYFGGDPKIKNPSRVMRLPGFDHLHLNGNGLERKRVTVHTFDAERRYTVVEMREAFPSAPPCPPKPAGGAFEYHEDRHEELCRRIMSRGHQNSRGNWDTTCLAHNGSSETGLAYFPVTGAVTCNRDPKCDYFSILRAEGLPDGHLPSRNSVAGVNDDAPAEDWESPVPFHDHDLPAFPSDCLPPWLARYVKDLACETQTPIDLAAMQALAICAGAVAGRVQIQARLGWIEPLNLYVISVLPPGERKSATSSKICKPLEELEKELIADERENVAVAASERRILEERLKRLEKKAAQADPDDQETKQKEAAIVAQELAEMKVHVMPRLICSDITPETLATLLTEQDGRMCLFSPEGDLFEMLAGRYTKGSPNIDVILKAHCGDPLRVDRRGRSEHVQSPALTIALCVQPEVIRGLVDKPGFRGRGLLARFLYSMPLSMLGRRQVASSPLSSTVSVDYLTKVKKLGQIEPSRSAEGDSIPRMLYLTPDADSLLRQFEKELEPQLGQDGALGMMTDWAGKVAGAILRIAGIVSLADQVEELTHLPQDVSAEAIQRAITIGRYLIPHAIAAYAEMGADPQVENAKRLLRWIERKGQPIFTRRECQQENKRYFKKVTEIDPVLELLEAHGYIRARMDTSAPHRGRPASPVYDVNPFLFSSSRNSHISHNSTSAGNPAVSENCETVGSEHCSCDSDEDVIAAERRAIEEESEV